MGYGDGYIDSLSAYIQRQFPGIKGFTRRGLYRMKQFYETYAGNEKVSTLLTQIRKNYSKLRLIYLLMYLYWIQFNVFILPSGSFS